MKFILVIPVVVGFIGITGCVLTHPTDPYHTVTPQYRRDRNVGPAARDDSPTLSGPLTREEAIDMALDNNPGLAAQERETNAARARERIAEARRLPNLRGRSTYTSHVDDQPLLAASGGGQEQIFSDDIASAEMLMDVPLFTGGRITSQIQASELLRKASNKTLARTKRELIFNVSSLYYSMLSQKRVIGSLEFSRETLREHLKQVKNLISNQKATKVDRLRTEVRISNVEEELERARNILKVKRHTLANLLGVEDTAGKLKLAGDLDFDNQSLPPVDDALDDAIKQRADYQAARRRVEAQAKQVDSARSDRWPDITASAAYGDRWDASHIHNREDAGSLGVTLVMPLFEGGRIDAAIREQKSELGAEQHRLRELRLQIRLDIKTARSNVASARKRVQSNRKAVEQSKESLRIERLKHREGEAVITDVLDTQNDMLESETNYHRALADYNTALAELNLAMGKQR